MCWWTEKQNALQTLLVPSFILHHRKGWAPSAHLPAHSHLAGLTLPAWHLREPSCTPRTTVSSSRTSCQSYSICLAQTLKLPPASAPSLWPINNRITFTDFFLYSSGPPSTWNAGIYPHYSFLHNITHPQTSLLIEPSPRISGSFKDHFKRSKRNSETCLFRLPLPTREQPT